MRSKVLAATLLLVVFVLAAFVTAANAQSTSAVAAGDHRFHFTEKPGPFAVGLRVVDQYDFSRTYRPLTDTLGKPYQGERAAAADADMAFTRFDRWSLSNPRFFINCITRRGSKDQVSGL